MQAEKRRHDPAFLRLARCLALYFRQVPAELATDFTWIRRWFAGALATPHVFADLLFGWLL